MKIAISSTGKDEKSSVNDAFGRASYFIIAETDGNKILKTETIENTSLK